MLSSLPCDVWRIVIEHLSPKDLSVVYRLCRAGAEAAKARMHGCSLRGLPPVCSEMQLCSFFGLASDEAVQFKHKATTRRGKYWQHTTRTFRIETILGDIVEAAGGWQRLRAILDKRSDREPTRKEKLARKRSESAACRRRLLDHWLSSERPLGAMIDSVDSWTEQLLSRRGTTATYAKEPWRECYILEVYLGESVVTFKAPIQQVKAAVISFEREELAMFQARAMRNPRVGACVGSAVHRTPVWGERVLRQKITA